MHRLLPRRGAVPALTLALVALAGWAGLLALAGSAGLLALAGWAGLLALTRLDPLATPCAAEPAPMRSS
ncbi:hypothetical protein [Methylobacterium aquaticum]|uniref:Uncharacterized protein n=1 Tax=Methylobacterium aquaticum TaxID=270351 RepID=A0A0J6V4G0_9HYPH|nr:hypothetical protein [Methylobacterium aquaticum]KMO33781.1 hypothetical protein VP06_15790 [Methylobacterium aquaticum]